jgi:hypothetical protein
MPEKSNLKEERFIFDSQFQRAQSTMKVKMWQSSSHHGSQEAEKGQYRKRPQEHASSNLLP